MLIGQYTNTIDEKSRLIIPKKLRDSLGDEFIITLGLDGCLFVMSVEEWNLFQDRMRAQPMVKTRELQRYFFANASLVKPDKQGRVLLANHLKEAVHLTKDVVIIGAQTRVELWDAERWAEWNLQKADSMGENIAQIMDDIGV